MTARVATGTTCPSCSGGGGGGGGGEVLPLDAQAAALTPNAADDDFDGAALDAKWTAPITAAVGGETTVTVADGWVQMEPAAAGQASTGVRGAFGIRQAAPVGDFSIRAKIAHTGSDSGNASDARHGILLFGEEGPGVVMGFQSSANRLVNFTNVATASILNLWSGFGGSDGFVYAGQPPHVTWLRLDWDATGSTVTGYWSVSGVEWAERFGPTALASAPDHIGLGIWGNLADTLADTRLSADWFRLVV